MRYLLDTNAVIAILRGRPDFLQRMQTHAPRDFAMPSIVAHELFSGAYKGKRVADNLLRIEALQFATLDFDKDDARRAGEIRAQLAMSGHSIGPHDVLVAGQALARDLTLVTYNTREFQRVAGLHLEDWQD